jgi:hypothetical protein
MCYLCLSVFKLIFCFIFQLSLYWTCSQAVNGMKLGKSSMNRLPKAVLKSPLSRVLCQALSRVLRRVSNQALSQWKSSRVSIHVIILNCFKFIFVLLLYFKLTFVYIFPAVEPIIDDSIDELVQELTEGLPDEFYEQNQLIANSSSDNFVIQTNDSNAQSGGGIPTGKINAFLTCFCYNLY